MSRSKRCRVLELSWACGRDTVLSWLDGWDRHVAPVDARAVVTRMRVEDQGRWQGLEEWAAARASCR